MNNLHSHRFTGSYNACPATFEHYNELQSYTKVLDVERLFKLGAIEYLVGFEVSLKLWRDNEREPEIDCISELLVTDGGGHQVFATATLDALNAMAESWALNNIEHLAEQLTEEKE